jgi:hypothetical protein
MTAYVTVNARTPDLIEYEHYKEMAQKPSPTSAPAIQRF